MESVCGFCVLATLLLYGHSAGEEAARSSRQASDPLSLPFLQQLQKWAPQRSAQTHQDDMNTIMTQVSQVRAPSVQGTEDQDLGMDSLVKLVNSVRQTGQDRTEFQLMDGAGDDADRPAVSVVVETLTAEDLLASEEGRQQLSQLNAQLEQAVNSLSQRVERMQGPDQVGDIIETLQNVSAETMVEGLVQMLAGDEDGHVFMGMLGSQSLQAVNQLTQTLDQLPGLKGHLGKLYRFLQHLHACNPSVAKDMQQLLVNAVMSFQGMAGGTNQGGQLMEIDSMLEMALGSLNTNLELLEFVVNKMRQTMENPRFLPAVINTHCLVMGLQGELSIDIAVGCLEDLMQAIAMINQSEQMITTLLTSVTHTIDNPRLLQSLADFMKMPSLDKAFDIIHTIMGDLNDANADVAYALQTLKSMLQSLWDNQMVLETLSNLLQNPESSQAYENAMQFLKDATLGDPATQQLLKVVNDSINMMWREGNAQNVLEKLEEILTVLKSNQETIEPLNESEQALLDLLNKLLEVAQNATHGETTPTLIPTTTTTAKSVDTSTKHDVHATTTSSVATRSSMSSSVPSSLVSTTAVTSTSTAKSVGEGAPPPSARPTTIPDTNDDNGSAPISLSTLTLIPALLASARSLQRVVWF